MNETNVLQKNRDIKKTIKQTGDYYNNLIVNIIQGWDTAYFRKENINNVVY